jgi:HAD superfamily hydrolase (TIGR01548 family)
VKLTPELLVFDMDGVLVDVRESYHRTILETVRHFTGRPVSLAQVQHWKNRSGYNDDWKLTTDWIRSLGGGETYREVKRQFERFYWGKNGAGNVARERWLLRRPLLGRWAGLAELAIFTGRNRRELAHTLERFGVAHCFRRVVTVDDVKRPKPDPEGLLRILDGGDPAKALYLGDHIDDALAARRSGMTFIGVLPRNSHARRLRTERLRSAGAKIILGNVNELEKCLE